MIITVTLNASVDKAYHISKPIQEGSVSRVETCNNTAGGKGLNVSRIIKLCEMPVLATGLVGGFNGEYLLKLLTKDGIDHKFVKVEGETRSCINILTKDNSSTEFLEPGCRVTKIEEETFLTTYKNLIENCNVVTLSGSTPQGMSDDIYAKMIDIAKSKNIKVILDTSGLLLQEGIKAKPTMIKPNKEEMEALFHIKIETFKDILDYAIKLYESGVEYVVVSLGKDGALLVCQEGIYQGKPPLLDVVNTVGCGDSMVGAFAVALDRGDTALEALRYGICVSAANALSEKTGYFKKIDRDRIMQEVTITKL